MCCCEKFKLSGAFYPVLTFLYCVDELGLGQVGHGKCLPALDHSIGYGVLLRPIFHCCSQMMSHIPSCESPWSLLPLLGLGAVSLRQLHLCSPCLPEVQGLVGVLRMTCAEGDLRLTCLPFEDLYFWLCWNFLGAGKTASSSKVDG